LSNEEDIMFDRRALLKMLTATGIGTTVFHRALIAAASDDFKVTSEAIENAQWVAGISLDEEQRDEIARSIQQHLDAMEALREHALSHDVLPAVQFEPLRKPAPANITLDRAVRWSETSSIDRELSDEEIAFLPVRELSGMIRSGKLTSVRLTQIYLNRLKKFNPLLNCVVNLCEEMGMELAQKADREIRAGHYRGPLHGIPWGAKDLIEVPGYPTTWGVPQFRERTIDHFATVARRLTDAGAVLIAKLSLGAIAMGDQWFEGMTRCPWNPKIGSSGSSAGSACATAAGLVGFALGSETLGSIVSPSRRCGTTGLRPTFGRVSRDGCMPLSWTMDKIGPITRCVEDAAVVFAVIHGADGKDPTVRDYPFQWPPQADVSALRVGYSKGRRDSDTREDLTILKKLGVRLIEIDLPSQENIRALTSAINVEGASTFDAMLRKNEVEGWNAWPAIFRSAQLVTAVDYLRIMRERRKLMLEMEKAIAGVDVIVNCNDLVITNLTGHPSVVIPQGFRKRNDVQLPYSTIFTGQLNDETNLLALAHAYQNQLETHLQHPPLEKFLKQKSEEPEGEPDDGQLEIR
jgi:Asp-tRNA(Asn)/Glu-tRNA(Gln) amidotransferase A subunit family amidase